MGLELIVGPPNSGRSGAVLERLRDSLDADPVLVVPGGDDAALFERDLAGGGGAVGATIRTFASLVDEIAALAAVSQPPLLSAPQRLAVIRAAVAATPLRVLARSARQPGFAAALDSLLAELQAALVTPAELRAAAEPLGDAGAQELELAALFQAYVELRERSGRTDAGALAIAAAEALRADPAAWGDRPLFLYGFDDLTEAQLELIRLLAGCTTVCVAVNYSDRRSLTARARLWAALRDDPGPETEIILPEGTPHTQKASLRHLDRALFEASAELVEPDDGVHLLECAGERGEAEAVGIEIARLLAGGADPSEIVVALRHPAAEGPLFAAVLRGMGIPVALEASLPLDRTAVGRALITLCRAASEDGTPADLIAHLRADPSFSPEAADWAERALYRGEATTVDDVYSRWRHPPVHLKRLLDADGPAGRLRALAASARELAERPHRERAPLAGMRSNGTPLDPIELRAGIAAAELLEELALIGELPDCDQPDLPDAEEAIASASVPAWRGSAEGRVRITSPYRLRSSRARFLFCAALQEGGFPSASGNDPLIGEEGRAALGIARLRRTEQAEEERYLFGVCVSRPTERLYLSWRASDDEGHPAARSPFIDEVLDLFPAGAEDELKRTRGLAHPVPAPSEAPDARSLARALTLARGLDEGAQREALAALGADLETTSRVLELLAAVPAPCERPGPLTNDFVLADLRSREHLSAGSLENWVECSYRWFVNHELAPERLEPAADPLWLGGVIHEALHRLYADPPGDGPIPRPHDVGRWKRRLGELIEELVGDPHLAASTPARRLMLARARTQAEAFLEEEAESDTELLPRPDLLELGFGFGEDGDPGALELGDIALRGRIDRIDVAPDGRKALLRDYKTSTRVAGRQAFAGEGKLQLQLYLLVMRERLGLEPIGAVYHPLGARGKGERRPRGMLLKDEPLLEGMNTVRGDPVEPEEFERELDDAVARARERGAAMREGRITRDPLDGKCPRYCAFQPICRLERAVGLEDDRNGENG